MPTLNELKEGVYQNSAIEIKSQHTQKYHLLTGFELGTKVHTKFLSALKMISNVINAKLIFTPVNKHVKALSDQPCMNYITKAYPEALIAKEYRFNEHLKLYNMRIPSQNTNPLIGLKKVRDHHRDSVIVGHSQIMQDHVATGLHTHPRMLISTGVCTLPDYLENTAGLKAAQNHTLGALLIENIGKDAFLIHTLYWDEQKQSVWVVCQRPHEREKMCWLFDPSYELPKRGYAKSLILGDYHVGEEDPIAVGLSHQMIRTLMPEYVGVHDFWSFMHGHHSDKFKSSQIHLPTHLDTITKDAQYCKAMFDELYSVTYDAGSQIVMIPSNHHEHIAQMIDTGRYLDKRGEDYLLLNELAYHYHNKGVHPLQQLLDPDRKFAYWNDGIEDLRILDTLINVHGDKGAKGSRGSFKQLADLYMRCIIGHYHTHQIIGQSFALGTLSVPTKSYQTKQPRTETQGNVLQFQNGKCTPMQIIRGKY